MNINTSLENDHPWSKNDNRSCYAHALLPPDKNSRRFRILRLHPSTSKDAELKADLLLRTNEEFEALSWFWDSAKPGPNIEIYSVDGSKTSDHLPIKPNLELALKRLRYETSGQNL